MTLKALLTPPLWLWLPVGVLVWVGVAAVLAVFVSDGEPSTLDLEGWFVSLFGGALAGVFWTFLLLIGVPIALALGAVWWSARQVAGRVCAMLEEPPGDDEDARWEADKQATRIAELERELGIGKEAP